MTLWNNDGLLADAVAKLDTWRVPKFIRHDEGSESDLLISQNSDKASILLLEDLGEVGNLREWIELMAQPAVTQETRDVVSSIGKTLGTSLATMHSQQTAAAIESRPEISAVLSQSLTDDVVWYLAMEIFPTFLEGVPNAEKYYQRLVEDIKNPKYAYPTCLMHGDFNFGNIMVPLSPTPANELRPYVIDWEFATSKGRGVNGDISEFLSILHCRLISARRHHSAVSDLLRLLCNRFCEGYRQTAMLSCTMEAGDLNSQLYRSALLLNGRDMINYAQDACNKDEAFDEMMKVGLWYLERAGDDMDELLQDENRLELVNEDEGLIRSLFTFS